MKVTPTSVQTSTSTSLGGRPPVIAPRPQVHPMGVLLFGKKPPRLLDRRRFPKLKKALRKLEHIKEEITELMGLSGDELSIELCEGSNASISRDGRIAVGVELLEEHQDDNDFLVGVLGHEIGHQPWTWPNDDLSRLNRKQLNQLYKDEEAKADRFMGRVLADLDSDPDAICRFLAEHEAFEGKTAPDYYPAKVRVSMIRSSFRKRLKRRDARRRMMASFGREQYRELR
jgi:hypothetical protein